MSHCETELTELMERRARPLQCHLPLREEDAIQVAPLVGSPTNGQRRKKRPEAGGEADSFSLVPKQPPPLRHRKSEERSFRELVTTGEMPGVLEPLPGSHVRPFSGYYLAWNLIFGRVKSRKQNNSLSPDDPLRVAEVS